MRTVLDLLERNASFYPDKEALIYRDRRYTYAQMLSRGRKLAAGLYELGARHQHRIAILAMNCSEYFDIYSAGEVAGFITVPINFRLALPEIAYQLKDSSPEVLFFEEQYADVVGRLRGDFPDIKHYVCIGTPPPWAVGFSELMSSGSDQGPPICSREDDYAYLFYTSGTTGRPKGVVTSHRNILNSAVASAYACELTVDSRVLISTPLFHVGGKGYQANAMARAAAVVLQQSFDPVAVLQTIQQEGITFMFMVGAMIQAVLDVPTVKSYDLTSLRNVVTAAAPIPVPLLLGAIEVLGPVFSVQYGSTEGGMITTLYKSEVRPTGTATEIRRLASVGHPITQLDLRLVDEQGNDCKTGVVGEVCIRSEAHMTAYWNNTAATLEAIRDGWLYLGDMGYMDEEGYLFLVDRKKDMIISGGENIYSREVEEALLVHPEVSDAAVIGIPDVKWGEVVKAYVVCKPDSEVTETLLIAHSKTQLASYKCPKSIQIVKELPRVPSGKVNKVALRELSRS